MAHFPDNSDAAFRNHSRAHKPSPLLLHYNYGAAAIKNWGHGKEVLKKLIPKPPHPEVPVTPLTPPAGPSYTKHGRGITVAKLKAARDPGGVGGGTGGLVESEDQEWDEDDMMLFLWGNTQAAKDRHLEKASKDARRIEQWRGDVPQGSV